MAVTRAGNVISMSSAADFVDGPLFIKGVEYSGAATAGDTIQITTSATDSNVLFEISAVANATVPTMFGGRPIIVPSLYLNSIDSGKAIVYIA